MNKQLQKGFTLIELLIVITIITALAVAVFVALNPAQRLKDARDARRTTDVDSILTAMHEYIVDNKGSLPAAIGVGSTLPLTQLGVGAGCALSTATCTTGATCLDLSSASDLGKYLKTMPIDPLNGSSTVTKYAMSINTSGLVTVTACSTEGSAAISASR
jgi:prepilin-type N-terminal cleavage/methylation domain-containing protein